MVKLDQDNYLAVNNKACPLRGARSTVRSIAVDWRSLSMQNITRIWMTTVLCAGLLSPDLAQAQLSESASQKETSPVNHGMLAQAYFQKPSLPSGGVPGGRRRGGAGRDSCPKAQVPLTALAPQYLTNESVVWGLTSRDRPTIWVYIPYQLTADYITEFRLEDDNGRLLYQTTVTDAANRSPGIVGIRLPKNAALQVGQRYQWTFSLLCNANGSSYSAPTKFVQGWVQRVAPNDATIDQLPPSRLREKAARYAKAGLWFDALTLLAESRLANPNDAGLTDDWQALLRIEGLDEVARQPIVPCCTLKE